MKTLVLGGIKSGKSRYAESLATATEMPVVYIATATAEDAEMRQRIKHHKSSRPSHWRIVEEPVYLADAIADQTGDGSCVLVDCLTLWMTNLLLTTDKELLQHQKAALINAVKNFQSTIVLVSNETSMGVVPMGELTRQYCDETGVLHQELAAVCNNVVLTVAGLPSYLKGK